MCRDNHIDTSPFHINLVKNENHLVTLVAKGIKTDIDDKVFAKFEGNNLVEIMVPNTDCGVCYGVDPISYVFSSKKCEYLRKAIFPKHTKFGNDFLQYAFDLQNLDVPLLEKAGNNFLKFSQIKVLNAPKLKSVGDYFLYHNEELVNLNAPYLETIGKNGLYNNDKIKKLDLPVLRSVGDNFLYANSRLDDQLTKLPILRSAGRDCQPLINEWAIYNKMKRR